jgi:hypothetical protein
MHKEKGLVGPWHCGMHVVVLLVVGGACVAPVWLAVRLAVLSATVGGWCALPNIFPLCQTLTNRNLL